MPFKSQSMRRTLYVLRIANLRYYYKPRLYLPRMIFDETKALIEQKKRLDETKALIEQKKCLDETKALIERDQTDRWFYTGLSMGAMMAIISEMNK